MPEYVQWSAPNLKARKGEATFGTRGRQHCPGTQNQVPPTKTEQKWIDNLGEIELDQKIDMICETLCKFLKHSACCCV